MRSLTIEGQDTDAYSELSLVMAVAPDGHGVAVRADAEAVWVPGRTPAEHIPTDVRSVAVTLRRPGRAPTVHRVVTGRGARALANVINRLPAWPPGTYNCPADFGFVDALVFEVPGPDIAVHADITGCGIVSVAVGGRSQPALSDAGRVNDVVVKVLGLPSKYTR